MLRTFPVTNQSMELFLDACGCAGPLQFNVEYQSKPDFQPRVLHQPFAMIGRDPRVDMMLNHPQVSRRHAYLQMIGGRLFCVDMQSRTGIHWVWGAKRSGWLEPEQALRIGPYWIRLTAGARAEEQAAESELSVSPYPSRSQRELPEVTLEFENRASKASTWPMTPTLALVGKAPECRVHLVGRSVSRLHCSLVRTPRGVWVVDLLGRSGVWLNDNLVRCARLEDGDRLRIGKFIIRPRYDTPPLESPPPDELVETETITLEPPARERSPQESDVIVSEPVPSELQDDTPSPTPVPHQTLASEEPVAAASDDHLVQPLTPSETVASVEPVVDTGNGMAPVETAPSEEPVADTNDNSVRQLVPPRETVSTDGSMADADEERHRQIVPQRRTTVGRGPVGEHFSLGPSLVPLPPQQPSALSASEVAQSVLVPIAKQLGIMQQQMFDQFQQAMMMMFQMFSTLQREQMSVIRSELGHLRELTDEVRALQAELAKRTLFTPERPATPSPAPPPSPEPCPAATAPVETAPAPPTPRPEPAAVPPPPVSEPSPAAIEPAPARPTLSPEPAPAPPLSVSESSPTRQEPAPQEPAPARPTRRRKPASAPPPKPAPVTPPLAEPAIAANSVPPKPSSSCPRQKLASAPAEKSVSLPQGKSDEEMHAWLTQRISAIQQERQTRWQRILNFLTGQGSAP